MRENCLSGSTSGMWKRSMVRIMRHRLTKGPETARPDLTHRATSRLYPKRQNEGYFWIAHHTPGTASYSVKPDVLASSASSGCRIKVGVIRRFPNS